MRTISRRAFLGRLAVGASAIGLTTLAGCAAPAARASPSPRLPRIGFLLTNPVSDPVAVDSLNAFREGLRELGYVDGETIAIEVRSAEGKPERFPELAADIVRLHPELILTSQPQAAVALKNATSVIPIVFVGIDPSVVGITDLGRPGGNLTGLGASPSGAPLAAKRLEFLKDAAPRILRVAFLWNPDSGYELSEIQKAAAGLGIQVHPHEVRSRTDFDVALAAALAKGADALQINARVLALPLRSQIAEFALKNHLPSMHTGREFVEAGGLMSYAGNSKRTWRRAATYVDRILRGARATDLPVEESSISFELVINLCTAARLGLTIPPGLMSQLAEAIQCAP